MAEEYKNAAEAACHEVTLVDVAKKKIAGCLASYSPGVYDAAIQQYKYLLGFWKAEDTGIVTAKVDEQKTDETRQKIQAIVGNL